MTRLQFVRAFAAALGVMFALPGSGQVLNVSATVASTCLIVGGALAFGTYSGVQTDASGTIVATCTNGSTAYVLMGEGTSPASGSSASSPLRQMSSATGGLLSYGLYITAPGNTVWGNTQGTGKVVTGDGLAQTLTVYGRIPAGQYNATAGLYTDTVQVSFTF